MTFCFKSSIILNRICSINLDVNEELVKLTSQQDSGFLYFCRNTPEFISTLRTLTKSIEEGVILLRVSSEPEGLILYMGTDLVHPVPLIPPTLEQWQDYVRQLMISQNKTLEESKKRENNLLDQVSKCEEKVQELKQKLVFSEKENQLLRRLTDRPEPVEKEPKSTKMIKLETLSEETTTERPLPSPSRPANDSPSTSSHSMDTSFSNDCDSEGLLRGIAQYILCQLCPEKAQDQKVMEDHFMDVHVDKEKHNCSACPTENATDLAHHMRIHTNRVYACNFCGKRGRKYFLKSHIRTHTGEKPFACDICGKNFADSSTLRRHQLVHSGEKKHNCPICGRGIARKDNVKAHIKSHGLDVHEAKP